MGLANTGHYSLIAPNRFLNLRDTFAAGEDGALEDSLTNAIVTSANEERSNATEKLHAYDAATSTSNASMRRIVVQAEEASRSPTNSAR